MEKEFDMRLILKVFRDYWWKILVCGVVFAILFAAYALIFEEEKYESVFSIMIINRNANDFTQSSVVDANEQIGNMHVKISKSDDVIFAIQEHMQEEMGYSEASTGAIKAALSVTSDANAILTYRITTTDPELSYDIACAASSVIPDLFVDRYLKFPTERLQFPTMPSSPSSPNIPFYGIIGFVAGVMVLWLLYFIKSVINTSIITKKDLSASFPYPVIGEIPRW